MNVTKILEDYLGMSGEEKLLFCRGCDRQFRIGDIVVFHVCAAGKGSIEVEPVHAECVVPEPPA